MKISQIICAIYFLSAGCAHSQNCDDNINKLPMYGGVKKCKEQIEADKEFLSYCDKIGSRKDVAAHMVMRGWEYLYKNQLDTSVMRFNQAWLLDSLNAEIYWGFGDVLGMQNKFKESLPFFERALKLNPDNAKIWQDASTSYGNVFFATKDKKYLNLTINALKNAVRIDPQNPKLYGQLTAAYSYYMQKDSARKYMTLTDKLDPNAVNPQVRAMLKK